MCVKLLKGLSNHLPISGTWSWCFFTWRLYEGKKVKVTEFDNVLYLVRVGYLIKQSTTEGGREVLLGG